MLSNFLNNRLGFFTSLLTAISLLNFTCNDEESPSTPADYSCIKIFDINGQGLGIYGCAQSDDWGAIPLSEDEKKLLDFPDTITLIGDPATSVAELAVFPNPVTIDDAMMISPRSVDAGLAVKLKYVIIDEDGVIALQNALLLGTNEFIAQQIPATVFQTGRYYRMYYRVSSTVNPALLEGYGNILVCREPILNGNIDGACF